MPLVNEDRTVQTDLAYQDRILQGVSRTFALTIPQLPPPLCRAVGNAYLLCRIADTIEDEPTLDADRKRRLSESFNKVLAGRQSPEDFVGELHPRLSPQTLDAERDLILNTPRVVRITRGFPDPQRRALQRCVRIMSRGMAEFQQNKTLRGLEDLSHLDRYCYHVAGVVGEMLTELFCDYSAAIEAHREELFKLALSFGQGLQMTNILKDLWEDRRRGACWLPRDVFHRTGFDLGRLSTTHRDGGFEDGLIELIGIARMHLGNALAYTLMLPRTESGIRRFCLWALGMAVLTLRKIHARLGFTAGSQVKISRASVTATTVTTAVAVSHDSVLRFLFDFITRPLPAPENHQQVLPV